MEQEHLPGGSGPVLECRLPPGYSSPRGLSRVYYFAHRLDQENYLDQVAQDIWSARKNCAIYYAADPAAPWAEEALRFDMGQAQLIVFPVTSNFLEDEVCVKAFGLAAELESPVPILPLQMEPGLEERFDEKCGSYQLLWKEDRDPTVIPYERKLRRFLDKALLDGKELGDIAQAFLPRHIFLSYRKKDRALAQQLMKRLHDLPGRDNIPIWYDEFLSVGERWDREIENNLKGERAGGQCGLMVLALTPNVLERPNFVLDTEYPAARDQGLPILPVEMERMEELPAGMDGQTVKPEEGELAAGLQRAKDAFGAADTARNEMDRYRLGLAYLNGVQVEVDRERGLALLQRAAEHGYRDAILKLADLYASGNGVELDYDKAAAWEEKALGQLRKNRKKQFNPYFQRLLYTGLDYYSAGRGELARRYLQEAVDAYEECARRLPLAGYGMLHLAGAIAYKWLAYVNIQGQCGEFEAAEELLGKAEELEGRVYGATEGGDQNKHAHAAHGRMDTCNKLNLLCRRWARATQDPRERRRLLEKALERAELAAELGKRFPGDAADQANMIQAKTLFESGRKEEGARRADEILRGSLRRLDAMEDGGRKKNAARLNAVMYYVNVIELLLGVEKFAQAEGYIHEAEALNAPLLQAGETQARKYEEMLAGYKRRLP